MKTLKETYSRSCDGNVRMENVSGRLIISAPKCRGCLSCQLACSFVKYKLFNPLKSHIRIERDVETEDTYPVIDSECDLCGGNPVCAEVCPYGAIEFEK